MACFIQDPEYGLISLGAQSAITPRERSRLEKRNGLAGFWVHPADGVFPLAGLAACLAVQTCLLFILGVLPHLLLHHC